MVQHLRREAREPRAGGGGREDRLKGLASLMTGSCLTSFALAANLMVLKLSSNDSNAGVTVQMIPI
jgi:hypothetical protein